MTGSAFLLDGCSVFGPTPYNYRMTFEIDTPQGVKTFSSVRSISYSSRLDGGYNVKVKGEAVVIDLPGGPVFALLSGADGRFDYAGDIAEAVLAGKAPPKEANLNSREKEFAEIYPTAPRIVHYMPANPLPMLVRFSDISDPTSVERVDPEDLQAVLGAGISLKRVTISRTRDPVTAGIARRLSWLSDNPEPRLDPDFRASANPTLPQRLWHGNFKLGTE